MLKNDTAPEQEEVVAQKPATKFTREAISNYLKKITTFGKSNQTVTETKKTAQTDQVVEEISTSKFLPKRWHKIAFGILLFFIIVSTATAIIGLYTYSVAMDLKVQAMEMKDTAYGALIQFNNQNLEGAESELNQVQEKLEKMERTYHKLGFYKIVPVANQYYNDGQHVFNAADAGVRMGHKSIEAIKPYADILGFTGDENASASAETAENRIKIVLETLDKISPVLDDITGEIEIVTSEIEQIDPKRYPEEIRGIPVRSQITQAKEYAKTANNLITQFRPVLERAPEIAGAKGERKQYLILFQNDGELRPTGGFMTAYSVIWVEDGKVYPDVSDDIYALDTRFTEKIEIPEQLGRYLTTEKYFNLRDMNIYPDFAQSMELFNQNFQTVSGAPEELSGIIAIDTNVLVGLLEILGPINMPGYGTFSAEPGEKDLPQVVHALSEIITRPTPYIRDDRKGIIGPMMSATLNKAYQAPDSVWPKLFEFAISQLEQKHIQVYFFDDEIQQAMESINAAGSMTPPQDGEDFLAIINANLGGAKSNFFISSEVTQLIEDKPVDGMLEKTVEISYKNNQKADNCNLEAGLLCLNATNRDWTRLYVPLGSELVQAQGFNNEALIYDENGFTIIEGFFTLEPESQAKLKITYKVPYTDTKNYKIKLWKQGGIDPVPFSMEVTGGQEDVLMDKDITYETRF